MNSILKFKKYNKLIDNEKLKSDKDYTLDAEKILSYLLQKKRISKNFFIKVKNSEEYLSYIKHAIMQADWKFDDSKEMKRETWRIKCVLWEIYRIFKQEQKDKKHLVYSFSEYSQDLNIENILSDNFCFSKIDDLELYNKIIKDANTILEDIDLEIFLMFFRDNKSMSSISKEYEISNTKTKRIIDSSIRKIKKYYQ